MTQLKTAIQQIRATNLEKILITKFDNQLQLLCNELGKKYSQLHPMIYKDKSFGDKVARNIEEKLKLPVGYLDKSNDASTKFSGVNAIPVHSSHVSAGLGEQIVFDEITEEVAYISDDELIEYGVKLENLMSFKVRGDSMRYTICDGSLVVVDRTQQEIIDNKIYAIVMGEDYEAKVKRLQKAPDGLIIKSDNPDWSEDKVLYAKKLPFKIIGRVLSTVNKL